MSQEQYNSLMSSLLKEKRALAKLREELEEGRGSSVGAAKGSGTWPETAGIKRKRKKGQKYLKINLKF